MPAPAPLAITNPTNATITIQTHAIAAGATYNVPFASLAAFGTDPLLRVSLLKGQLNLFVYGYSMSSLDAANWMDAIFRGSVVYASY